MSARSCPDWPTLLDLAPDLHFKHYTVAEARLPADALVDLPTCRCRPSRSAPISIITSSIPSTPMSASQRPFETHTGSTCASGRHAGRGTGILERALLRLPARRHRAGSLPRAAPARPRRLRARARRAREVGHRADASGGDDRQLRPVSDAREEIEVRARPACRPGRLRCSGAGGRRPAAHSSAASSASSSASRSHPASARRPRRASSATTSRSPSAATNAGARPARQRRPCRRRRGWLQPEQRSASAIELIPPERLHRHAVRGGREPPRDEGRDEPSRPRAVEIDEVDRTEVGPLRSARPAGGVARSKVTRSKSPCSRRTACVGEDIDRGDDLERRPVPEMSRSVSCPPLSPVPLRCHVSMLTLDNGSD